MQLKPHMSPRMLCRLLGKTLPAVGRTVRSVNIIIPAVFYSTQKEVGKYGDDAKGSSKFTLAKDLAGLLEESTSYLNQKEPKNGNGDQDIGKMTLAQNLASLVQESYDVQEQKSKPKTRLELKGYLEMRIKKKVKAQYRDGKFQDLLAKVIADPKTLKDAYDCIRVTSNVDLAVEGDNLLFESIAGELANVNFDCGANIYSLSTRGMKIKKEKLVLPNLKLRVVQETIRIVLEVVYRPHFSKLSHGGRSGRSHRSALRYIRKEITDPDWWFTLLLEKKLDICILDKLLSSLEEKIEDPRLCAMIRSMFDANVLNMDFGAYPKGHGLPQEGVLSPILMNIYLDLFDREIQRMIMRYEVSNSSHNEENKIQSKLRGWFRRQINGNNAPHYSDAGNSGPRVHCCRFMDEVFFAISGPKEVALAFKSEVESYLRNSLYLEVNNQTDILACSYQHGIRFLGSLVKRSLKETPAVRAVHKLKEKVKLFAEQKQESWDTGCARIGKKWLAHGLKKVKESEIKHLGDGTSQLHQISCFRKSGMKTDHWYKVLLKIWMQDMNCRRAESEGLILAKHIAEPSLPQELRDSYYEFQRCAKEYVSSETASTLALVSGSSTASNSIATTEIVAPVNIIKKRLHRYGLTNKEGYARTCHVLILLDDSQIINWFSGIVHRWLRWYSDCENFSEVKLIICSEIRMSCIRTLAAKYRVHEADIEKKFDPLLSRIPSNPEVELEEANAESLFQESTLDGSLTYGINYSGLCLLSLARMASHSRHCECFVIGCSTAALCVYTLHVMERQKFPGWKTGFSSCIHPGLNRRRIGLCKQHLMDLFLGDISLQSIDFGAWR